MGAWSKALEADLLPLACCFIVLAASLGRRTMVAPDPSPIELVELERIWLDMAGIGGSGGGVWAENAQNRLGDLGGGGGDFGRVGARGVSEPKDELLDGRKSLTLG